MSKRGQFGRVCLMFPPLFSLRPCGQLQDALFLENQVAWGRSFALVLQEIPWCSVHAFRLERRYMRYACILLGGSMRYFRSENLTSLYSWSEAVLEDFLVESLRGQRRQIRTGGGCCQSQLGSPQRPRSAFCRLLDRSWSCCGESGRYSWRLEKLRGG